MCASSQSPQLRMAGSVIALVGGILVVGSQVFAIQSLLFMIAFTPIMPPEYAALWQSLIQMAIVNLAIALTMGVLILIVAIVIYMRRGRLGGILAIVFAAPVFFVTGLFGWVGAVLAIVGGALGIASTAKPAEPKQEVV